LELLFQGRLLKQLLQTRALFAVWFSFQVLGNGLVASKAEEGFKCHSDCFAVCVGLHHHSLQVAFAADRVFYKKRCFLVGMHANPRKLRFKLCGRFHDNTRCAATVFEFVVSFLSIYNRVSANKTSSTQSSIVHSTTHLSTPQNYVICVLCLWHGPALHALQRNLASAQFIDFVFRCSCRDLGLADV